MNKPLVSVLMTAYNREKYIAEAIESVILSTYANWELIITDDCSTDGTLEIARKFESTDRRVKVYKNIKNLGDYANRNQAASYANGKYLKYLDADDLIYPYGLAAMVHAMERFPEAAFGLSYNVIDDKLPYPQFVNSKDIIRSEYLGKSLLLVGPSASIIRKDIFRSLGGFSGKQYIGDTELWLKIASSNAMVKMAPALNWYRSHDGQQIQQERKNYEVAVLRYLLSNKYLDEHEALFTAQELSFAKRKLKRNFARKNLRDLLSTADFIRFLKINKGAGFSLIDITKGFRPYLEVYPKES